MSNGNDDDKSTRPLGATRVEVRPNKKKEGQTPAASSEAGGATQLAGVSPPPAEKKPAAAAPASSPEHTIIHHHRAASPAAPAQPPAKPAESSPKPASPETQIVRSSKMQDQDINPVAGWFVIVSGPGKGASLPIFEGMNSVGRGPENRVQIDMGDQEISRDRHFFVAYEPEERIFHLTHGSSSNFVRLKGKVVLAPMQLAAGDDIKVGKTTMRFVPFCGPDFSWDDHQ